MHHEKCGHGLGGEAVGGAQPRPTPVIAAKQPGPASQIDATGRPTANNGSRRRRALRSGDRPPVVVGLIAKDPEAGRSQCSLPVRGEGHRKNGTEHDGRRFDGPAPPSIARAQQTAFGPQKQMVGVGRTDREHNGAADEHPAIGGHPCRAVVARAKQPAPCARIMALCGARGQEHQQHE